MITCVLGFASKEYAFKKKRLMHTTERLAKSQVRAPSSAQLLSASFNARPRSSLTSPWVVQERPHHVLEWRCSVRVRSCVQGGEFSCAYWRWCSPRTHWRRWTLNVKRSGDWKSMLRLTYQWFAEGSFLATGSQLERRRMLRATWAPLKVQAFFSTAIRWTSQTREKGLSPWLVQWPEWECETDTWHACAARTCAPSFFGSSLVFCVVIATLREEPQLELAWTSSTWTLWYSIPIPYVPPLIVDAASTYFIFVAQLPRTWTYKASPLFFSNDIATFRVCHLHMDHRFQRLTVSVWKVENTLFRVHEHFLSTYSPVFRDILRRQPSSSDTSDNGNLKDENQHVIHLDDVSVLEFESLLTFFYER